MNIWGHFKTITHHKNLVLVDCFKVGLYRQGLLHDLSKYSPVEFWVGCKYYQGTESPNNAERRQVGYSSAWLHHKGRNKHHLEYWIDYDGSNTSTHHAVIGGMKMPVRYVCEMFVDRVCASKNYQKEAYTQESALRYYNKGRESYLLHEDTRALLEYLLTMLAVRGEKETYDFVKNQVLKNKIPYQRAELEVRKEALKVIR